MLLWHFGPQKAGNGLILNGSWESMGYKGAFCRRELRKYVVGMTCRQTEQRIKGKMTWRKGKVNVEEKATQRGVSAYTTWSIE